MTAKEAIEYLNDPIGKSFETHIEAVTMATRALEKLVPRKPIENEYLLCPMCRKEISAGNYGKAHCSFCGQALKWRPEE